MLGERDVGVMVAAGALAVLTNGPVFFVQDQLFHHGPDFESTWARWWFGGVAVLGVALLVHHLVVARWVATRRRCVGLWLVGAFLAVALASSTWSAAPALTLRRALVALGLACLGVWFAGALTRREQLRAVALGMQTCVLLSVTALALRLPHALQDSDHRWNGIYPDSNSLGSVAGIAALSVGALALSAAGGKRRLLIAVAIGDLAVLTITLNITTMTATVLAAACAWLLRRAHLARTRGASAAQLSRLTGSIVSAGAVLTIAALPLIGRLFQGDGTFSHHTEIWSAVWAAVRVHPIRGHGFFAFWDDADLVPTVYRSLGFPVGSAHNSLLETALGLGAVGVVLFLAIVALAAQTAIARWWWSPSLVTAWWVCLLVFVLVENMGESFVVWYSVDWVLLVAAASAPALGPLRRRPFATVVVRSQGRRQQGLRDALGSLAAQRTDDFEVVVVAHGGRERVAAVRRIVATVSGVPVRVVRCGRPGRGAPLNTGIDVARGRYVVFLDDDDLAEPDWIEQFAIAAPREHSAILRARSQVQRWSATADGDPVEAIGPLESPYAARFDIAEHLASNRTPICSMALPLDLLRGHDIRADESLMVLEDFDLLMHTALVAPIVDIDRHTSLVRQHDGENSMRLHGQAEWDATYHSIVRRLTAEAVSSTNGNDHLARFGP